MDRSSNDVPDVGKTDSDAEVDMTTTEITGGSDALCSTNTTSESISPDNDQFQIKPSSAEDCERKEAVTKQVPSSNELGYRESELYSESGSDDDDDDAEVERQFYATSGAFPHRRTYSSSDVPNADQVPQIETYDSEAKNRDGKQTSKPENSLKLFPEASAVWSEIRGQSKPSARQREINSDGEFVKIKSYSELTKINSILSTVLLKRSASTPPVCSSETSQRRKYRVIKSIRSFLKSGTSSHSHRTTTGESNEEKSTSESEEKKSPISAEVTSELDPSSSRTSENTTDVSSENKECYSTTNQTLSSDPETDTSSETSEMSRLLDLREKLASSFETASRIKTSCTSSEEVPRETNAMQLISSLEKASGTDANDNSGTSDIREAEKMKSLPEHNLETDDTRSSESSEISHIIEAGKTMPPAFIDYYSTTDTETSSSSDVSHKSSADIETQKSPPRITSEPPSSDSGVFKVPARTKDYSTQSNSSPSPKPKNSHSAPSSIRRPSDFNLKPRSAFYTFNSNSPTGLVIRPYRSLPNVNRPSRNNMLRRSVDLDNLRSRVVRSLFTGGFNSQSPSNSRNGRPPVNEDIKKQLQCCSKSKTQEKSLDHSKSNSCPKACPKITKTSEKGTNTDVILQENLSGLVGEITKLQLQDALHPPVASSTGKNESPRRRVVSPSTTIECSPAKRPRTSSELDSQKTSEKEELDESSQTKRNLLKPPSSDVKANVSPKRKVENLKDGGKPDASSSDASREDESSESAVKKTRVKPRTPEGETDAHDCLPEPEGKSDSKDETKN